jgi:hypothetical protein
LFKVHVFQFKRQFKLIEWRAKVRKSRPDYQGFLGGLAKKRTEIKRKWLKMPGF